RRRVEGQHTSSGVLTFVEVIKGYVESAWSDSYPHIKGIRSRVNFIQDIVSRYLAATTLLAAAKGARLATTTYGTVGSSLRKVKLRKPRFVTPPRKVARRVPMFRFEVSTALFPCATISSGASDSREALTALVFPALALPVISVQRS